MWKRLRQITTKTRYKNRGHLPNGRPMPTLDEETARSFRTAQLQRRRWARVYDAFAKEPIRHEHVEQLMTAARAATEIEYRQSSRRLFILFDRLTTELLREGDVTGDGYKARLLSRAQWHSKLADQSRREGDLQHAEFHQRLYSQLRDYAAHGTPELKVPEPPKPAQWRPGMRSII
jgi:hypothetical protein